MKRFKSLGALTAMATALALVAGCTDRPAGTSKAEPAAMPAATAAAGTTATYHVGGMTCTDCEQTIKQHVSKIAGVKDVRADYKAGTATVTYDPAQAQPDAIRAAIREAGYQVKD